jgi:hypothetical protein
MIKKIKKQSSFDLFLSQSVDRIKELLDNANERKVVYLGQESLIVKIDKEFKKRYNKELLFEQTKLGIYEISLI